MTTLLSFRGVSCQFDGDIVVDNVSLDIAEGEIVCLLGASGCGKTTSLRLAAGMEPLTDGEIWLNGACVSTPNNIVPPEQRNIGFLFQDFALFPHLTVLENVMFGLHQSDKNERRTMAEAFLARVELAHFGSKFPHILSGGEQQRVALARALAPKPCLVLMDEPFSNLDAQLRDQMRDLTVALLHETGAAGLVVTHDSADALRMADRIAVQKKGKLIQIDKPEILYNAPKSIDVAVLFGTVNFLPDNLQQAARAMGLKAARFGVRPQVPKLSGGADDLRFEGEIIESRPLGLDWLCYVKLTGGTIWQIILPQNKVPEQGVHKFFVSPTQLMLFN